MNHKAMPTRKAFILLVCIMLLYIFISPSSALSKREHVVHFPNTAYELNIYKIYGKQPGKTVMLIGGIQGNEPGGFLSADLYADMSLEKGNLIVVPRANFYSIILNKRGPHGDMNRKFSHENKFRSVEDKIVTILKELISESDYLLNLHDGAGYYYPKHLDKWRNPMRFGQSIIADCLEYRVPGRDKTIKLGEMAQRVIREINPQIKNKLYKFHFMNTMTDSKNSPHREQRKSATYYALTKHHIPAFGIETSKFLPSIDLKVRYHNLVINAFLKHFGIIPQSPSLALHPPELKYIVVSINGQVPIVVKNNQPIKLWTGDSILVSHIEANYERGLSLDILGYGDLNDFRKGFKIFRNTSIIARKDNYKFAEIPIKVLGKRPEDKKERVAAATKAATEKTDYFIIETMGHRLLVANGETLDLVRGDRLKIVDIIPSTEGSPEVKVNFKGFVGDWKNNTGEDRGYLIHTGADLIKRYSLHKRGKIYEIIVTRDNAKPDKMFVRLTPPKLDYLVLKINDHRHVFLRHDDTVSLSADDKIGIEEIQTNLFSHKGISLDINGRSISPGERKKMNELGSFKRYSSHMVKIKKGPLVLGKIFLHLE